MKADSWILRGLPELLVDDWYNHLIFSEFDVQVAAYHHLREVYEEDRNERWRIRTQPYLKIPGADVKPDIVIYKGGVPYDVIEIKCMLDGFSWPRVEVDLDKLQKLKRSEHIRHAYMLVIYDDDDNASIPTGDKDPWMKNFFTFVGGNVRRHESGRLRNGYDDFRQNWETYYRR